MSVSKEENLLLVDKGKDSEDSNEDIEDLTTTPSEQAFLAAFWPLETKIVKQRIVLILLQLP